MTDYWSATAGWAVGLLLLASGLLHARRSSQLRLALADRRLSRLAPGLVPLVVLIEVAVGVLVVVATATGRPAGPVAYTAAAAWFGVLAVDLVRTRLASPWASCGCPGADGPIGAVTITRAAGLAVAAGGLAVRPPAWPAYGAVEQAVTVLNGVSAAVLVALLPLVVRERLPLDAEEVR